MELAKGFEPPTG